MPFQRIEGRGQGLHRDDETAWSDELRQQQRVETPVRTDIDDGVPGPHE
jgi:hypothetical protein